MKYTLSELIKELQEFEQNGAGHLPVQLDIDWTAWDLDIYTEPDRLVIEGV